MNEAHIDLTSQDSTQEVPAAADESADDRLLTRRLPPVTPPPPRTAGVPPSSPPPALAPSGTYPANPTTQARTSWWNALLTATSPPPAMATIAPADEGIMRRRIGATCAGMAIGFVILGLALGLRGAEPAYTPMVAAAFVLSRALVSLGFLGFGYGLLRMAERLFTRGEPHSSRSNDAG